MADAAPPGDTRRTELLTELRAIAHEFYPILPSATERLHILIAQLEDPSWTDC